MKNNLYYAVALTACILCSGCGGRFVFKPDQQVPKLSPQEQQAALAARQRWQNQAGRLDNDNQELESLLAQSRQQIQLLRDEVRATRGQLKTTTNQLADSKGANQQLQQQTKTLAASVQRRTAAEIRPNNSLISNLAVSNIPGVSVRQDGDVVRVEIPTAQLFQQASPYPISNAESILRPVVNDLMKNYPGQIIGIEGHTDKTQIRSRQYASNFHLSVAQSMAVYEILTRNVRVPAGQLFIIGHGSNHPIASNATPAGQAKNRRIELVVYPERATQ